MKELFQKLSTLFNFGKECRLVNQGEIADDLAAAKADIEAAAQEDKAAPEKVPADAVQPVEAKKREGDVTAEEGEKPFIEMAIDKIYENIKELPKDLDQRIRGKMKNAKIDKMSPEDLQKFAEQVSSIVNNYTKVADEHPKFAKRKARLAIRKLAPRSKAMEKKIGRRDLLGILKKEKKREGAVADVFGEGKIGGGEEAFKGVTGGSEEKTGPVEDKPYFAGWGPEGGEEKGKEGEKARVAGGRSVKEK